MNKTMKLAIPVVAGMVAIGTGVGLVAAKSADQERIRDSSGAKYDVEDTTTLADGETLQPGWCGGPGGANGMMGRGMQATTQQLADLLGLTKAELQERLQSGETLADIAEEKGVGQDALVQAILAPMTEHMSLMLKYGYLTQEQVDAMVQQIETRAQAIATGDYAGQLGVGFGGFGHGMMGGWADPSQPGTGEPPCGDFGGMMGNNGRGMMDGWQSPDGTGPGAGFGGMMGGRSGGMMGGRSGGMMGGW